MIFSNRRRARLSRPAQYRHVDGKLELKVTNDRVCLKYVTDQQQDLKRIEKRNNLFLTYMCGKDPYADPAEEPPAPNRPNSGGDEGARSAKDTSGGGAERPPSGGGKKKKPKK